ncbi:Glycine dehydrogenase [decarboxylating] (glycine cleavage system P1 protein) [Saccharolobus shibatae B12]|uniref:Probable glycine dehydrogenase (decarboxylating) subunit 1 n=1 Tax=Saccharolobus shibatae (strain ATCC 51178 / DSM 5389 / JCM 8931 / NBRC 15437 / B12) TaxID=523848 RepID=A0A8F5BQN9_SACSH|nr:aminomethyl-transferring glycine dehydrogenase subunit GcvPA [Saccharolobus shibatae]QXJ29682.1 Glycine dehydrogenase [decarboxylating] (glycine cleavage system P1 protein) [Saccharolobus shibatae B12]
MYKHPWLPNLDLIDEMLKEIGVNSLDELFNDIPAEIKINRLLNVAKGKPLSEYEIEKEINEKVKKNVELEAPPFIGAGICPHYIPNVVKFIIGRSEFYTSYTPYQPEISQGLLQALFEYQSLMAELLDMDVVNASMYDWGSALAEAVLMANRINGKKTVLVPENANPFHKEVLRTWIQGKGIKIEEVKYDKNYGELDLEDLEKKSNIDDISAIYIQQPNFFGIFESNIEHVIDVAKHKRALSIVGVNPLSLGLIKPPGSYEADIVVGDGQELGLPLNFGGPLMGVFAVRWDMSLVRQMPGRIVGITKDINGKMGFTLILQTREQFIKREKATSNITTNEALLAIANAVYLSLLGKEGMRELAEEIYFRSHYAAKKLTEIDNVSMQFRSDFFEEFAIRFPIDYDKISNKLKERKLQGGLKLSDYTSLFCVTEVHDKKSIDLLVSTIQEVINGVETS